MDNSIIVAIIFGACGIIMSVIFGWIPRSRKEKIENLQKELLDLYNDILLFHQIEDELTKQLNRSKIDVRKEIIPNAKISQRSEVARATKRKEQLESRLL